MKTPTIEAGIQTVTPKMALRWLEANHNNRNVRERVVTAYARDMKAGRWRLTGEAVKFSADGRLIDGQHRLRAVVQAGINVDMMIVRGLDDEVQEVLDSGAGRSAGDALRMRGETNYSNLAATARAAMMFEDGRLYQGGGTKYTHGEIIEFLEKNPEMRDSVEFAVSLRHQIDIPISVLGVCIWRLAQVAPDDCTIFFTKLGEKTGFVKGDPILALHNRLTDVRRTNRALDRADYLSLVFRSWNAWRQRKSVHKLPTTVRGEGVDIPEPR